MNNINSKIGFMIKQYFSFVLGTIFGSTIATVVTYVILSLGIIEKLVVEEPAELAICLMEKMNE
jgi:hypothetical protein